MELFSVCRGRQVCLFKPENMSIISYGYVFRRKISEKETVYMYHFEA
tara:strand:- start:6005 stop:6145 length:141 start_codon:yes stop_codon:yes gene_type:complete